MYLETVNLLYPTNCNIVIFIVKFDISQYDNNYTAGIFSSISVKTPAKLIETSAAGCPSTTIFDDCNLGDPYFLWKLINYDVYR